MNAQCGTTINSGVCYNSTDGLQIIAVDICPDTPTKTVNLAFTAGSVESCCDEIVVYSGAVGTGTGGTIIHNATRNVTSLGGLVVNGTIAGECLHIYINADVSVDCTSGGGVPPSFDITCVDLLPPEGCLNTEAITPICVDQSIVFGAGTNQTSAQTANPNVNYGCVTDARNPAWHYLEINTSGALSFDIMNSNSLDIDWAIWGPFADLTEITSACGSGVAPFDAPLDCDYTTAASGIIDLGLVTTGDIYVVLVTNFSNNSTDISMTNTAASTATTNCSVLPPNGYWINSTSPDAGNWGTCPYPVITDAFGTMYDEGGPSSPTADGQSQIVSVCPDGAATVDLTITYNLQDPLGLGDELVAIFDDKSRNNGLNEIANINGTGTQSYTTTGPCFTIMYQPKGGEGFRMDWSINTAGVGTTFPTGDMCEDAFIITSENSPLAMSTIGATSGPVYNAGAIIAGTGCDPDLIGDGCTTTVENTVYATFTSCAEGGAATLTLTPSACSSTGQTPQMFLYTGTCGNHTFVDCSSSLALGGSPILNATLTANTEYTIVIDGFRGIECNLTIDVTGCIETTAVACADCLETACTTAPVFSDFAASKNNYTGVFPNGWPTANEINLGSFNPDDGDGEFITVCTDIIVADIDPDFMGFDQFLTYTDGNGDVASCATRSIEVYQEVGGVCNLLTPTSINPYNVPEFDNPLGTTYDGNVEMTVCVTYTDDVGGCPDVLNNSTVVAYGCAAVTDAIAGTQSACNPINNTYTQDVAITWNTTSLPSAEGDGSMNITINGVVYNISETDITVGTTIITLTDLPADGNTVDVVAAFTKNSGCAITISNAFVAPVTCEIPACATSCTDAATNSCNVWLTPADTPTTSYVEIQTNGGESCFPTPLDVSAAPSGDQSMTVAQCWDYTHNTAGSSEFYVLSGTSVFENNNTNGTTDCEAGLANIEIFDASCTSLVSGGQGLTYSSAAGGATYTVCVTAYANNGTAEGQCDFICMAHSITPTMDPLCTPNTGTITTESSGQTGCDFTLNDPVTITQTTAFSGGTQYYYLFDCDGDLIAGDNTTADFGPQPYGCYEIYAVNSCLGTAPAGITSPTDITALSLTDYSSTATTQFTVCNPSILGDICEGEDVTIVSIPNSYETDNDMTYILVCEIDGGSSTISATPVTVAAGTTPAEATFTTLIDPDASTPNCTIYVINHCPTADMSALVDGADWVTVDPAGNPDVSVASVAIELLDCVILCDLDAGTGGASDICNSGNIILDLLSILGGTPDAGGVWEDTSNSGIDISDPTNVDFAAVPPGSYIFTYTIIGTFPCPNVSSQVEINLLSTIAEICLPSTTILSCTAASIILDGTCSMANGNNIGYSWSGPNGQIGTTPTQSVTEGGVYTLMITDLLNGCTHSDNIEIIEAPNPNVVIYQNDNLCEGDSTSLLGYSGNLGGSYTWSGEGVTIDNENDNPIYLPILPIGTYIYDVVYIDTNGCITTNSKEIEVVKAPDAGINGTIDVCNYGDTKIDLLAALGGTPDVGTWEDTDNSGVDLLDPTNVDFLELPEGNYTFIFIVEGDYPCANDTSELEVNVFSIDVGTNAEVEICNSGNTELNLPQELGGTQNMGGVWIDAENSGVNLSNPTSVDFSGIPVGSYIFIYTVPEVYPCGSTSSEVVVNVLSAAVEITTQSNSICEGEPLELLAESLGLGNNSYSWTGYGVTSSNSINNSLLINDLPVGIYNYTVTCTNAYGCTASDSRIITVAEAPNAGLSNSVDICDRQFSVINFFDLLGGMQDMGGIWIDIDNAGVDLSDITNIDFTNVSDGSYTFMYTVLGTTPCGDVSSELVVNISTVNAGENGSTDVCNNGDTIDLLSVLGGIPNINGTWEDTDNSGVNLKDPTNVDFSNVPAGSYTFTYTVMGAYSCNNDISIVTINVSEIINDFCFEANRNTVAISNNSTGSAALSYLWDFGDGASSTDENPIHTYPNSTNVVKYEICLTVTFADGTTCCSTCCKEITIYPPCQDNIPGPTFNYLFKNNGYVKFNNPSGVGNAYTKEWTIDGVFHSDLNQPPTKILNPGIHRVCLTVTRNSNPNCSETFCRDILVNDPCVVPSKIEFSYETCLDSKTFLFGAITTGTNDGTEIDWDFGNGDSSSENVTQYTYPDYGSYMVCLNVTNSENCSKKVCGIIEVVEPACENDCPSSTTTAKVASDKIPRKEPLDELNKGTELQIIPNPASNMVNVIFKEIQFDKAIITLRDMKGKIITHTSVEKGTRNYKFDISNLPSAVYIVLLEQANGEKISSKIIKM